MSRAVTGEESECGHKKIISPRPALGPSFPMVLNILSKTFYSPHDTVAVL